MKITLTWLPSGSSQPTSFVLADSPGTIPLRNLRLNGSRKIQEADFFRNAEAEFYDRGNRKTEVSFETTRLWPDQNSAESFLLTHGTEFPGLVNVSFRSGSGAGPSTTRYLAGAAVETFQNAISGFTTTHSYRLTGGVITTVAPTVIPSAL